MLLHCREVDEVTASSHMAARARDMRISSSHDPPYPAGDDSDADVKSDTFGPSAPPTESGSTSADALDSLGATASDADVPRRATPAKRSTAAASAASAGLPIARCARRSTRGVGAGGAAFGRTSAGGASTADARRTKSSRKVRFMLPQYNAVQY